MGPNCDLLDSPRHTIAQTLVTWNVDSADAALNDSKESVNEITSGSKESA
jgi:hypothetical protein